MLKYDPFTMNKYDFYLASPFFNEEQQERERAVCRILREKGYRVFAPFEHGVLKTDATFNEREWTFRENVDAINQSDAILAITDGKDIGTIWEAGYGYGRGKKVYYFCETLPEGAPFNIMLGISGEDIFLSRDQLMFSARDGFKEGSRVYERMGAQ